MSNYPAMKIIDGYLGTSTRGSLSHLGCRTRAKQQLHPRIWQIAGHRKQSPEAEVPYHRGQLRRSAGLPEKGRRRGTPVPGWLERTGILPPQQLAAWLWGPLPLARSRFASLHPHRLLACGYRCFPSLGFELPALTNRCRTASPAPSALRPSGERRRPRARAGRRRGGSLRGTAPPNGRARSSGTREVTGKARLSPHILFFSPAAPPPHPAHH